MIRPVMNLITKTTEYIGTFEQIYLGICITHDEFVPGVSYLSTSICLYLTHYVYFFSAYNTSRINTI